MRLQSLHKQRGVEIIEFALIVPMMLLLFFIFAEFGIAFSNKAVITDASRAAAREAIMGGNDTAVWDAADAALGSIIMWGGKGPYVCDRKSSDLNTNCLINRGTGNVGDPVSVTVRFTFSFRFLPNALFKNMVGNWDQLNLSGRTVMRMLPH
jgi:Flp pilus assembly protein TadG